MEESSWSGALATSFLTKKGRRLLWRVTAKTFLVGLGIGTGTSLVAVINHLLFEPLYKLLALFGNYLTSSNFWT